MNYFHELVKDWLSSWIGFGGPDVQAVLEVAAEDGVEDVDIYGSGDGAKSHGLIQDAQQALELWASYRR